jgi:hypothetical protein
MSLAERRRPARLLVEVLEARVVPTLLGNQLFPLDNPWNEKISSAPVAANSAQLVANIGATLALHPDFGQVASPSVGAGLNGIPFNVVSAGQATTNIIIDAYASESDLVPVPLPANPVLEGDLDSGPGPQGGDRHLLVYDKDANKLYELGNASRPTENADGRWHADQESVWDLAKDSFRPAGWTSADAAGLPILPGLVRPDEVLDQGVITHALRFTVPVTQTAWIYPASHQAGSTTNVNEPRMGERFRLKASFDLSSFPASDKVILQALKDYGMIVADNGSSWFVTGQPSTRWDDSVLGALKTLHGSDFEAVDLTPKVSSLTPASGSTSGGTVVTITGLNFSGGAGLTKVIFGTVAATSVTVLSDTQIQATAPAHAVGSVAVTVQSGYGTSAAVAAGQFTYNTPVPQPGQLQLSAAAYRTSEAAGSVTFTVTRTNGNSGAVAVNYATSNGSATAGVDYVAASGTLAFADGQTSQTFTVSLLNSGNPDGNETFNLTLSGPAGGATLGAPGTAVVTLIELNDDVRFVAGLYHDVLGRAADAAGLANFVSVVDAGRAAALPTVASAFLTSPGYFGNLVRGDYRKYLGRTDETPAEVDGWIAALQAGSTDEQVAAAFAGSAQYYSAHGGTDAKWTQAAFSDILGRAASASDVAVFTGALAAGATRPNLALVLLTSTEYRTNVLVPGLYLHFLGRSTETAAEVAGWVAALASGVRDEQVAGGFVASAEAFQNAGNTNTAWVTGLYTNPALLNVPSPNPADVAGWVNVLLGGYAAQRQAVAAALVTSDEYRGNLVRADYAKYLGRTNESAAEVAGWVAALRTGSSDEQIAAAFAGSAQYYTAHGGTDARWVQAAFNDILGRAASASDVTAFSAALAAGATRPGLALTLLTSTEYRSNVLVPALYHRYLYDGPAPAVGVTFWAGQMQNGFSDEQVAEAFLSSTEYFSAVPHLFP